MSVGDGLRYAPCDIRIDHHVVLRGGAAIAQRGLVPPPPSRRSGRTGEGDVSYHKSLSVIPGLHGSRRQRSSGSESGKRDPCLHLRRLLHGLPRHRLARSPARVQPFPPGVGANDRLPLAQGGDPVPLSPAALAQSRRPRRHRGHHLQPSPWPLPLRPRPNPLRPWPLPLRCRPLPLLRSCPLPLPRPGPLPPLSATASAASATFLSATAFRHAFLSASARCPAAAASACGPRPLPLRPRPLPPRPCPLPAAASAASTRASRASSSAVGKSVSPAAAATRRERKDQTEYQHQTSHTYLLVCQAAPCLGQITKHKIGIKVGACGCQDLE